MSLREHEIFSPIVSAPVRVPPVIKLYRDLHSAAYDAASRARTPLYILSEYLLREAINGRLFKHREIHSDLEGVISIVEEQPLLPKARSKQRNILVEVFSDTHIPGIAGLIGLDSMRAFVDRKMGMKKRYSGAPYPDHTDLALAYSLTLIKSRQDPAFYIAMSGHDLLEDTKVRYVTLRALYGEKVANYIWCLTKFESDGVVISDNEARHITYLHMIDSLCPQVFIDQTNGNTIYRIPALPEVPFMKVSDIISNNRDLHHLPDKRDKVTGCVIESSDERRKRFVSESLDKYLPFVVAGHEHHLTYQLILTSLEHTNDPKYDHLRGKIDVLNESDGKLIIEELQRHIQEYIRKNSKFGLLATGVRRLPYFSYRMDAEVFTLEDLVHLQEGKVLPDQDYRWTVNIGVRGLDDVEHLANYLSEHGVVDEESLNHFRCRDVLIPKVKVKYSREGLHLDVVLYDFQQSAFAFLPVSEMTSPYASRIYANQKQKLLDLYHYYLKGRTLGLTATERFETFVEEQRAALIQVNQENTNVINGFSPVILPYNSTAWDLVCRVQSSSDVIRNTHSVCLAGHVTPDAVVVKYESPRVLKAGDVIPHNSITRTFFNDHDHGFRSGLIPDGIKTRRGRKLLEVLQSV